MLLIEGGQPYNWPSFALVLGQRKGFGKADLTVLHAVLSFVLEAVMTCAMTGTGFRGGGYWIRIKVLTSPDPP